MLNGPDIRNLIKAEEQFMNVLNANQKIAWVSLKAVIERVLVKNRADNFKVLVENMLDSYKAINISMSSKLHFLNNHLDVSAKQSPTESDEQGERFHQITMPIEKRFKGKNIGALLGEVCWWSEKIFKYENATTEDENTVTHIPLYEVSSEGEYSDDDELLPEPKRGRLSPPMETE